MNLAVAGLGDSVRAFPMPLMGTGRAGKKNPASLASERGSKDAVMEYHINLDRVSRECKAEQRRDLAENARNFFGLSDSERPKDLELI